MGADVVLATARDAYVDGAGSRTLELMRSADRYNRWIVDRLRPGLGRRVIEVGCGMGSITELVAPGREVLGVDVVPAMIEESRRRLAGLPAVAVELADAVAEADSLAGRGFDSAVSVNVLEHVEDDEAMLAAIHRILQPGGTLALLVPAHPRLYGRFDALLGHHRRYTKTSLRLKLHNAGFQVESLRRTNPLGAAGWFVNVRVLRRGALGAVGLFDRLVPLLALADRVLEPPFGLSLVAIARKPR